MAFINKHSEGPYYVTDGNPGQVVVVSLKESRALCFIPQGHPNTEFNSKLIAQSPALLEIAESFYDHLLNKSGENGILINHIRTTLINAGVEIT